MYSDNLELFLQIFVFSLSGIESKMEGLMPSDEELDALYVIAWGKMADNLGRARPTESEVGRAMDLALRNGWGEGIRKVFGWSEDAQEINDILVAYDEILQSEHKLLLEKYGFDLNILEKESAIGLHLPDVKLQEGVEKWL